tara:strand:+ start:628 stop:879 length:252 start_codon:yes stop_codon:yes gene_type:complete
LAARGLGASARSQQRFSETRSRAAAVSASLQAEQKWVVFHRPPRADLAIWALFLSVGVFTAKAEPGAVWVAPGEGDAMKHLLN